MNECNWVNMSFGPYMSSDASFTFLLGNLIAASCFEDAATAVLQAMLACAEGALAESPYAARGRLLRGLVHLRRAGSYQRLFGVQHPNGARVEGAGYITSANVWRWVAEHRCSVSIDVQVAALRPWLRDGPIVRRELREPTGLPGLDTRERMLGRDTTHVHVVPLRAPGGGVDGMITLEADCKAAVGQELIWEACYEQLERFAAVAAPYLGALPCRQVEAVRTDEFLPVVAPSTAGLVELLRVFARQEETVLITGPTGAGKSRLARWCHEQSQRAGGRFETLDLLSVPEDLQMAELFGWKRGAFTGAVKDAPGAIARARRGTLFIDEIDKLSLRAQAGLLRVLEERRFRPLGDDSGEHHADVRFLVGTNADLSAEVGSGRFREDLYYRINVLPVRLPPLAERLDELPLWAEYMVDRRHREGGGGAAARLVSEAVMLLSERPWPGNLRQLDNIIRRAYALALADQGGESSALALERRHVERALAYEEGGGANPVVTRMWRAAEAFAREAERRGGGAPLSLDLCDAFRGMVLGAAVRRQGSRDEAFTLLGQQHLVKNRNHHRTMRRELDRVRELLRVIGGGVHADLSSMLDADEADEER